MRFVFAVALAFFFSASSYADSGVGTGGIRSTNIAKPGGGILTGMGIGIGQVEGVRPGRPIADGGPDDAMNSASTVVPAGVYMRTSVANVNGFRVIDSIFNNAHAQHVASIMISTDANAPGVAPNALLHAGGYATNSTTQRDAAITADRIADRNGGNIHAINMSFGMPLDAVEGLDGTAHLTQFIDWSAKEHDTLYVVAGRETSGGAGPVPSTNYNGITVASSNRDLGGGSWSNVWPENVYIDDAATAERVSVDLIAPGVLLDAVDVGGGLVNPDVSGTSFAAPHVTASVALLQEYAVVQNSLSTPGWGATNPRRHEVMKAILLNSAEKIFNVHDSSRTHRNRFGQVWDQTIAHNDPETPLDLHFGAGHLNVENAVTNFSSGEQNAGNVTLTGWDYGSIGGGFVDYVLDGSIAGDSWVSVTMAWDREVEMTGFGNNYSSTSDFFDQPINMELENLDLYFMPASSNNINDAVFSSVATGDSVEHIFQQLGPSEGGDYKIRVVNSGGPHGFADFGLAWRTTAAPSLGDNDGDGDIDGDDLNLWDAAFGLDDGGDADGDGDSDGTDFLAWQQNFTGPPTAGVSMTEGITTGGNEMYEISLDIPEGAEGTFDTFVLTVTPDAGSTFNQVGTPTAGVTQPSEDTGFVASLTAPPFFDGQGLVSVGIEDTSVLMEGTFGSIASNDASEQGAYLLAQIVMANAGGSGTYAIRFIDDGVEVATTNGSFGGGSLMAVPEPTTGLMLATMLGLVAANRPRSRLIVR